MRHADTLDPTTGKTRYTSEKVGYSKRLAELAFAKKMLEWERKKHLGLETKKDCTFSELVDWFLELHVTKKKKSYKDDVRRAKLLKQHFGWRLARDIKPMMVESFQQKMLAMQNKRGQFYRPATVNRVLALMKRFYNLAVREELVDKNPCWRVPMLAENNARDRVLSWDELEKLLK